MTGRAIPHYDVEVRWCPFARPEAKNLGEPSELAGPNRYYDGSAHEAARCIGEKCMAWVWVDARSDEDVALRQGGCGMVAGGRAVD